MNVCRAASCRTNRNHEQCMDRLKQKAVSLELTVIMEDKLSQHTECKDGACNRVTQGDTYRRLAHAAFNLGDFKTALKYFQLDLSAAKSAGEREKEEEAYCQLGIIYHSLRDFQKSIEFYQQGLSIAKELGNKDIEGKVYTALGIAYGNLGDFKKAIEFHQQALDIAKEVGDKDAEVKACTNLGVAYYTFSDFKKAIEFHQQALDIAKEVGDKDAEGKAYANLGGDYYSLSDFKKAIEFHQKALDIAKEVREKDAEGKACTNLGVAYYSLSDFKNAIEFHQQALDIAKEVGDKDAEGKAYANLGGNYYSLSDFKKAIEFHQQALDIAKEVGDKDAEVKACTNLGVAYYSLGDFKNATEFHQQALDIANEVGDKDAEGKACTNLGGDYYSLSDFKKAIEFHQQALDIAKEVGDKDAEVKACTNLGVAYYSLGDFKKATEFHQQALSIAKKDEMKDKEGKAYHDLGLAYYSLGDVEKAVKFIQLALDIAKDVDNKDVQGSAYNHIGLGYTYLGDFKTAAEFFQRALNVAKEVGNKEIEILTFTNLGITYHCLGDVKTATECFQQALGITNESGNKDPKGKVYTYLGIDYTSYDDFVKAIDFHEQAVSIEEEVRNRALQGKVQTSLGTAYHYLGDCYRAEDCFKSSVKLFDEIRDLLQSNDEWKINLRNQYEEVYSSLWRVQLQQNKVFDALFTAERGRAQALMDLMESQFGVTSAQPVPQEMMLIETLSSIASHTTSLTLFLAEAPNSVNVWILQKGQRFQQWKIMRTDINNKLEFLTYETYKQIGVFKSVMCENRSLDEQVNEESEEGPDRSPGEKRLTSSADKGDALQALSDVMLDVLSGEGLMQGDEVVIVPDGPLYLVPYAALVDQQFRYLSETLRFRLIPTLTSLKLMADCPEGYHRTSGALLVGDPWVESVRFRGNRVLQLPGARKEVEMIGKILKIEPLTGKDATKAEVLNRLGSVALVHIAAHGSAETGEIILSPNHASSKRPKEEDFLLTMADVLNAKLSARLIVLSCCHSGRGKIKAESVVGLARAFLGAGARSVLASLWALNDGATMEFMRIFYENLLGGQSASKSLNQAMKLMRESDEFRHIKYWAPFVLIGDDVTLDFGQPSTVSVQQKKDHSTMRCSCM